MICAESFVEKSEGAMLEPLLVEWSKSAFEQMAQKRVRGRLNILRGHSIDDLDELAPLNPPFEIA